MQGDLRFAIPLLVGTTACIVIVLSAALYFGENKNISWSPFFIMSVAIILRFFYVFRAPELSDDIYRYLWDGLQILEGNNPYAYAPLDTQPFDDMSADLLKKVNHPELITIYPPAAQLIFLTGVFMTKSVIGFKTMLCIIDLATCMVIIKILAKMELPVWRSVLYAWHPLPVLEIASSGHIDGAGIFFFLLTIYFLQSMNETEKKISSLKESSFLFFAGSALGTATLVKLYPLFLLPCFFIVTAGFRRLLFGLGVIASITILTIPFMPDLFKIFDTLGIYLKNWEFSSFAFRTLRNVTSSGSVSRLFLMLIFLSVGIFVTVRLQRKRMQEESDALSSRVPKNEQRIEPLLLKNLFDLFLESLYVIIFSFLLLTPTLYPWYVLSLVSIFPFIAGPVGIIFSWSVFLSYYIIINYALLGQWAENDYIPAIIWCVPVFTFLINKLMKYLYR
jgi:hypothetical protein